MTLEVQHLRNHTWGITFEELHLRYNIWGITFEEQHLRNNTWGMTFEEPHLRNNTWWTTLEVQHLRNHIWETTLEKQHLRTTLEGWHLRNHTWGTTLEEPHLRNHTWGTTLEESHLRNHSWGTTLEEPYLRKTLEKPLMNHTWGITLEEPLLRNHTWGITLEEPLRYNTFGIIHESHLTNHSLVEGGTKLEEVLCWPKVNHSSLLGIKHKLFILSLNISLVPSQQPQELRSLPCMRDVTNRVKRKWNYDHYSFHSDWFDISTLQRCCIHLNYLQIDGRWIAYIVVKHSWKGLLVSWYTIWAIVFS